MLRGSDTCDFLVVGAGVVGITISRELHRRYGGRVLVIEKEPSAARHASGRNSGVLHAGVYYQAGSLKARLCVAGNQRMRAYCRERGLPINECGKVIVARTFEDLPALEELHRRAQANGIEASIIDAQTLRELEPYAKTTERALYVKDTAVVGPQAVMGALLEDAQKEGVFFEFNCAWEHSERVGLARTARGTLDMGIW